MFDSHNQLHNRYRSFEQAFTSARSLLSTDTAYEAGRGYVDGMADLLASMYDLTATADIRKKVYNELVSALTRERPVNIYSLMMTLRQIEAGE